MATNFRVKIGKIGLFTFVRCYRYPKRIRISRFDLKRFNGNDLSTLCVNLVKLSPVTPEFTRVNGVHPSSIGSSTAAINIQFPAAITRGDTVMPGGLHASLCHAFSGSFFMPVAFSPVDLLIQRTTVPAAV